MLDPKYFQEHTSELEEGLKKRNLDQDQIQKWSMLSKSRKTMIHEVETLKAERNKATQVIAQLKSKKDPSQQPEVDRLVLEMRAVGDMIKKLDEDLKQAEASFEFEALRIPTYRMQVFQTVREQRTIKKKKNGVLSPLLILSPKTMQHWGYHLGFLILRERVNYLELVLLYILARALGLSVLSSNICLILTHKRVVTLRLYRPLW